MRAKGDHLMANATVNELRAKNDAVWESLGRVLRGMEGHLEQADAPGEWTTREVLCHLLFEPGWQPGALLKTFAERDLPVIEISPGDTNVTPERRTMTLAELADALESQRRALFGYLDGLSEADLQRK